MILWILQVIITSFILIYLCHHLIAYFKSTLTTPKVKDWVEDSKKKYDKIYDIINTQPKDNTTPITSLNQNSDFLQNIVNDTLDTLNDKHIEKSNFDENMKNELKDYLNSQLIEPHLETTI